MERPRCRLASLMLRDIGLSFVSSPSPRYYVPGDNPWPFLGALALFMTLSGAATLLLGSREVGAILLGFGVTSLLAVVAGWFISAFHTTDVAGFGQAVNRSFQFGVLTFLSVELFLFTVCWGSFAVTREWLVAPAASPTLSPQVATQDTLLLLVSAVSLLLSSVAVVAAQRRERRARARRPVSLWLAVAIVLGVVFLALQAPEYGHAFGFVGAGAHTRHPPLQLLCLSIHGVHVVLALVLLASLWVHSLKSHFTATQRFGLQAVTWYWHFLDASWATLVLLAYFR
jgi:cytochrome c oxidase subunit 3